MRTHAPMRLISVGGVAVVLAITFVTSAHATDPPNGCSVNGAGYISGPNLLTGAPADGKDVFNVLAMPFQGSITGATHNIDLGTGKIARGIAEYLYCRHVDEAGPPFNQAYFGGHAELFVDGVWSSGYWVDVVVKDHGEPGGTAATKKGKAPDTYHVTVRQMDDGSGSGGIVYATKGDLIGGNIQLDQITDSVLTPLPSWVALEP